MSKKVGVLLSGCGVFDGAEIHESVLTLLFLDRAGAEALCMAPDVDQFHVINHLTHQETVGKKKRSGGIGADRQGKHPGCRQGQGIGTGCLDPSRRIRGSQKPERFCHSKARMPWCSRMLSA